MKILYHHRVRSGDGQAVHITELIHAFRALGHEVTVVAPSGFEGSNMGSESALLDGLKRMLPKAVYELMEIAYNVRAYRRLRRAYLETSPDFVYERYSLYLLAGAILSRRHRVPLILEINSPLAFERAQFGGLGLKRLANFLEAWTWRQAAHVLPVTGVLGGIVGRSGVKPDRMTIVQNGINPDEFTGAQDRETAKAKLGLTGRTVLGFTGFMRSWHGLDAVIEFLAQAETPQALHLLLVGDGPARPDLERQVQSRNLQTRVTFAGLVGREAIAGIIASFDIALQPRAVEYASPLKLFEYMALGKAIVAPGQPNIREVLTDRKDALLFDPQRPGEMEAAIRLLASDGALRERLGKAARQTIEQGGFTWPSNAKRICDLAGRARHPS
jgi:glycosyltransferase involved in cell wall biosynthesis